MLYIEKGREPASLTQYKQEKYAYYNGCNKQDIRKALLQDQGYLCAYCMRRIEENSMKIEHWLPQSQLDERSKLDFSIMLGVCKGNEGPTSHTTCDTHRGNAAITINPLDKYMIEKICYDSSNGFIYSQDQRLNYDLNKTLNLNCDGPGVFLCSNRKAVLEACKEYLRKHQKNGAWSSALLQKMLQHYENRDDEGKKKEYAGIAIWYIKRRLKSQTK